MKKDINKRTLWACFLEEPTEQEIQETANTMKGGKGYLFNDWDGLKVMYCHRRLNEYQAKGKTFIRRVVSNDN